MEDVLTSNVFSFFKYSTREVFLKGYLADLDLRVSDKEALEAKFTFWPRFMDRTEPDLVIRVGGYYLLVEAKYFSSFGEETPKTKAQLVREIEGGMLEARSYGLQFRLLAMTADHYYDPKKFTMIPSEWEKDVIWRNWQSVCSFLDSILESQIDLRYTDRHLALDLYRLLVKKHLRDYRGISSISQLDLLEDGYSTVFFQARTARFRGDFIGFVEALSSSTPIEHVTGSIFLR